MKQKHSEKNTQRCDSEHKFNFILYPKLGIEETSDYEAEPLRRLQGHRR